MKASKPVTAKSSLTKAQRSAIAKKAAQAAWRTMHSAGYKKNPKQFMAARRAA